MNNFGKKKVITSAMRRIAPIGLATSIGWSVNPRALRWIIEMRTSRHAEEEIRLVFCKIAEIVTEKYPNVFGGFHTEEIDGLLEYTTKNSKV
jgi:thymidylate synthase (FAD)